VKAVFPVEVKQMIDCRGRSALPPSVRIERGERAFSGMLSEETTCRREVNLERRKKGEGKRKGRITNCRKFTEFEKGGKEGEPTDRQFIDSPVKARGKSERNL